MKYMSLKNYTSTSPVTQYKGLHALIYKQTNMHLYNKFWFTYKIFVKFRGKGKYKININIHKVHKDLLIVTFLD